MVTGSLSQSAQTKNTPPCKYILYLLVVSRYRLTHESIFSAGIFLMVDSLSFKRIANRRRKFNFVVSFMTVL